MTSKLRCSGQLRSAMSLISAALVDVVFVFVFLTSASWLVGRVAECWRTSPSSIVFLAAVVAIRGLILSNHFVEIIGYVWIIEMSY